MYYNKSLKMNNNIKIISVYNRPLEEGIIHKEKSQMNYLKLQPEGIQDQVLLRIYIQ